MNWEIEQEGFYHRSSEFISDPNKLDQQLSEWLAYVSKLTGEHTEANWDCVVCDLWPENGGRLIANAQLAKAEVGSDIGFRVCANLALNQLWDDPDYLDEEVLYQIIDSLWSHVRKAAGLEPAQSELKKLSESRKFQVYGTYYGESLQSAASVRIL